MATRIFLTEYLTSGSCRRDAPLPESLAREGRLMLEAVGWDLLELPDTQLVLTWDERLTVPQLSQHWRVHAGETLLSLCGRVTVHNIFRPEEAWSFFEALTRSSDQVLIIAPEFDSLLVQRLEVVDRLKVRGQLNCSAPAAALCGDKFRTAQWLQRRGVSTIPTVLANQIPPAEWGDDLVVKPRDGAGSVGNQRLTRSAVAAWQASLTNPTAWIMQPYVPGRALSVAMVWGQIWPVAEQLLSDSICFQYSGGRIPARDVDQHRVQSLIEPLRQLPGLAGYVGFDLIQRTNGELVLVEINPRLTTSYLGYRDLARISLAPWLLRQMSPAEFPPFQGEVEFQVQAHPAPS